LTCCGLWDTRIQGGHRLAGRPVQVRAKPLRFHLSGG
jgi:hypothetical protein